MVKYNSKKISNFDFSKDFKFNHQAIQNNYERYHSTKD